MRIVKEKSANIDEIVKVINKGEIVVLPTETVYITSIDAINPEAVKRLCAYKNRPIGKPFSVAVSDIKMAEQYVELNKSARELYVKFLPGPVTVVSKRETCCSKGNRV